MSSLTMARSKFTEERRLKLLKQNKRDVSVKQFCRREGICEATYYNWKKLLKYEKLVKENEQLKPAVHANRTDSKACKPNPSKGKKPLRYPYQAIADIPANIEMEFLDFLSGIVAEIVIKELEQVTA